jgi:hypothetical protein
MKLSLTELGETEVRPGMTLAKFYEDVLRRKCCENIGKHRFCCEGITLAWLAEQAGVSRERFIRNILPQLKKFDHQYQIDKDVRCTRSRLGGTCGWILRNAEGEMLNTLEDFDTNK